MVFEEVVEEIVSDDLAGGCALIAQRVGDKLEVCFQRRLAVDRADKLHKAVDDIVLHAVILIGDRQAVIVVRQKGFIFACVPFASRVGKAGRIEAILSEHAADCVGNQGNHLVAQGAHIITTLHGLRHIVFAIKDAMHGHILISHIRR